jgi:bacteriocin biosynthesis cyclodehydratase domain-containing protein
MGTQRPWVNATATTAQTADSAVTARIADPAAIARIAGAGTRARTPAEAILRRSVAKVLVTGSEPLVAPIAIALAGAGVGHVYPSVDGQPRVAGLLSAMAKAAPGTVVTKLRAGAATMIVRVGVRAPAVPAGRGRRAAVLDVTVRDGIVLIGPLVRPTGSPCGRCLELHRRDRDPAWPALAAQLVTAGVGADGCPLATVLSSAAFAADEVLAYLDGRRTRTDGASVELRRPGDLRRRSWPPHPRCDCRRQRPKCDSG